MAPSKKRRVLEHKAAHSLHVAECPCVDKPRSDGICELCVWQGTMIDTQAAQSSERLLRPRLPVVKYKHWTWFKLSGHLYHLVILGWPQLITLFVALYVVIVGVFALMFAACKGIGSPTDHAEARYYFNLSLQTLATIGYGYLYPKDACSNWVSVAESFVAMLLTAFLTGVAFVKFARPRPNIIFSKVFTVSQREDSGLEMRFRVVNGTRREIINRGEILEVSFKLILMRVETTKHGDKKLCYYDLHLKTNNFIALRLEAELVHHVDQASPFSGLSQAEIERSDFLLILMMAGVDQNLHDTIHKQHEYDYHSMKWAMRFVPMLDWNAKHACLDLDFEKVSAVVPDPIDTSEHAQIDIEASPQTVSAMSGVGEATSDAWNVEGLGNHDVDLSEFSYETRLSPGRASAIPADSSASRSLTSPDSDQTLQDGRTTAAITVADDEEEEVDDAGEEVDNDDEEEKQEESKSETSTKTNSGSDKIESQVLPRAHHHIRFDSRSRSTMIQIPRLPRRRHNHEFPASSADQPASVTQRIVRFKHHPLSIFSKGLYYHALETSWPRLFVGLVIVYFAMISVTAFFMLVSPGTLVLQTVDISAVTKYEELFFFCTQTISTIGYGSLSPNPDNNLVNFFVLVLVVAGTIVSTLLTGLAWAKFSIPEASALLFSDNLLLTAFHGNRAVMFRAANNRTFGSLIEGSFRVSVVVLNQRLERRETHELKLIRNVWPIVQLGTIVTHIIDEDSPLYDLSTDDLLSGHHFFVVLFTGLDSVIGENMFARKTYHSCDVLVGHHFVDNIKLATDGLHIDLEAINDTQFTPDIDLRESRLYAQTEGNTAAVANWEFAENEHNEDDGRSEHDDSLCGGDDGRDMEVDAKETSLIEPTSPACSFVAMEEESAESRSKRARAPLLSSSCS